MFQGFKAEFYDENLCLAVSHLLPFVSKKTQGQKTTPILSVDKLGSPPIGELTGVSHLSDRDRYDMGLHLIM